MKTRICPKCGSTICYKREDCYQAAVRDDNWCKTCSLLPATRTCSQCGDIVEYSNRHSCLKAIRKNQPCRKCADAKLGVRYTGEGNPFFGKQHSDDARRKMSERDYAYAHTDWFKQRRRETSLRGRDNPMYGKSPYEVWVDKYGKDKADNIMTQAKLKWSLAASGENNPMFGRPSPSGSGNGWKGWYHNWFFRSLHELSYMINVIEKGNHTWRTAESRELSIPYIDPNGVARTYRADFLVDNKMLVEVKPIKLHSSRIVRAKELAAMNFCEARGWMYCVVDPPAITEHEIKMLHDNQTIIFMDKYEIKFQKRYHNE